MTALSDLPLTGSLIAHLDASSAVMLRGKCLPGVSLDWSGDGSRRELAVVLGPNGLLESSPEYENVLTLRNAAILLDNKPEKARRKQEFLQTNGITEPLALPWRWTIAGWFHAAHPSKAWLLSDAVFREFLPPNEQAASASKEAFAPYGAGDHGLHLGLGSGTQMKMGDLPTLDPDAPPLNAMYARALAYMGMNMNPFPAEMRPGAGTWHHVALSLAASSAEVTLQFWLDGVCTPPTRLDFLYWRGSTQPNGERFISRDAWMSAPSTRMKPYFDQTGSRYVARELLAARGDSRLDFSALTLWSDVLDARQLAMHRLATIPRPRTQRRYPFHTNLLGRSPLEFGLAQDPENGLVLTVANTGKRTLLLAASPALFTLTLPTDAATALAVRPMAQVPLEARHDGGDWVTAGSASVTVTAPAAGTGSIRIGCNGDVALPAGTSLRLSISVGGVPSKGSVPVRIHGEGTAIDWILQENVKTLGQCGAVRALITLELAPPAVAEEPAA